MLAHQNRFVFRVRNQSNLGPPEVVTHNLVLCDWVTIEIEGAPDTAVGRQERSASNLENVILARNDPELFVLPDVCVVARGLGGL